MPPKPDIFATPVKIEQIGMAQRESGITDLLVECICQCGNCNQTKFSFALTPDDARILRNAATEFLKDMQHFEETN